MQAVLRDAKEGESLVSNERGKEPYDWRRHGLISVSDTQEPLILLAIIANGLRRDVQEGGGLVREKVKLWSHHQVALCIHNINSQCFTHQKHEFHYSLFIQFQSCEIFINEYFGESKIISIPPSEISFRFTLAYITSITTSLSALPIPGKQVPQSSTWWLYSISPHSTGGVHTMYLKENLGQLISHFGTYI